jgi:hypothetical protein
LQQIRDGRRDTRKAADTSTRQQPRMSLRHLPLFPGDQGQENAAVPVQ